MATTVDGTGAPVEQAHSVRRVWQLDIILFAILLGPVTISLAGKSPNMFWSDLAIVYFAVGYAFRWFARGETRLAAPPRVVYWMLAYIAVAFITVPMATDMFGTIADFKQRILPVVVFLLANKVLRSEEDVSHLLRSLALFGIAVSAMTVFTWFRMAAAGPAAMVLEGLTNPKDMAHTSFGRSNYLASIFIMVMPIAIGVAISEQPRRRLLGWLAATALLIGLLFTQSRGAMISLVAGGLLWRLLSSRTRLDMPRAINIVKLTRVCIGLLLLVVLGFAAWSALPENVAKGLVMGFTVLQEQGTSDSHWGSGRGEIWSSGLSHVADAPILGIGLGNQYRMHEQLGMYSSSHNLLLDTLLETGILGFVTCIGILVSFGAIVYRLKRFETGRQSKIIAGSLFAAYIICILNALEEPSFWGPQYAIVFWTLMAAACVRLRASSGNDDKNNQDAPGPLIDA